MTLIVTKSMPNDYPPVTQASIDAAIAARNAEREEAKRAAAELGWVLEFDIDGRPYDASEEPNRG